jgi:hypothetical protein
MDEDAKVHWAETADKPRYRQFTLFGEPWAIWLDTFNPERLGMQRWLGKQEKKNGSDQAFTFPMCCILRYQTSNRDLIRLPADPFRGTQSLRPNGGVKALAAVVPIINYY